MKKAHREQCKNFFAAATLVMIVGVLVWAVVEITKYSFHLVV
jgi:hypothetical protein